MRLRTFSRVLGAVLGAVGLVAMAVLLLASSRLRNAAASAQAAVQSVYASEELRALLLSDSRNRLRVGAGIAPRPLRENITETKNRWLDEIDGHVTTPAEAQLAQEARKSVNAYFIERQRLLSRNTKPIRMYLGLASELDRALLTLDRLIEINRSQTEELRATIVREDQWSNLAGSMLLGALFFLIAAIGFAERRLIHRPLLELEGAIDTFGRDGTVSRPGETSVITEFRRIGGAFHDMGSTISRLRKAQLRFVAGAAHDIKNPLHAVQTALRLAKQDEVVGEQRKNLMEIASRQVARLGVLASDLANTASIEAGHIELRRRTADVSEIVSDIAALFAQSSPIHIVTCEAREGLLVDCDPERISQVITNLFSNAIKYSPEGGRVSASVRREGDRAVISVTDDGVGIAADDQSRIFEPFRRASATSDEFEGLGLGLSTARRIIEAHGGTICVASEPGRGSTFTVVLPRANVRNTAFKPDAAIH